MILKDFEDLKRNLADRTGLMDAYNKLTINILIS